MKILIVLMSVLALSMTTFAACKEGKHEAKNQAAKNIEGKADYNFKVSGMSCGSCANKISKKLLDDKRIENVVIDVDSKTMAVYLKKGEKLTAKAISDMVAAVDKTYIAVAL
jgi:copper chaperone CopZ